MSCSGLIWILAVLIVIGMHCYNSAVLLPEILSYYKRVLSILSLILPLSQVLRRKSIGGGTTGAMGALAPVLLQQRGHCPGPFKNTVYHLGEGARFASCYTNVYGPQYIAPISILEIIFLHL